MLLENKLLICRIYELLEVKIIAYVLDVIYSYYLWPHHYLYNKITNFKGNRIPDIFVSCMNADTRRSEF